VSGPVVYRDYRDDLERYEFQMGVERGRLALTMDLLTDALVLVGQHGVYCQSARTPGKPVMDVRLIQQQLEGAKQLVVDVMTQLKNKGATFRSSIPEDAEGDSPR